MAQHLCIVARDNPLLLGYLNIALDYLTHGGNELEIVIDRRPEITSVNGTEASTAGPSVEQRRLQGVDDLLRSRGYAIVRREPGHAWRVVNEPSNGHASMTGADETEAAPAARAFHLPQFHLPQFHLPQFHLPEFHLPQFRVPQFHLPQFHVPQFHVPQFHLPQFHLPQFHLPRLSFGRRRVVLAAGALAVIVLGASVGLSMDLLDRAVGAAGHAVAWLRSPGDAPADVKVATAPREPAPRPGAPREPAAREPALPVAASRETAPPVTSAPPEASPAPPKRDVAQAPAPERPRPLASATPASETAPPPREVSAPPSEPRVTREPSPPAREPSARAETPRTTAPATSRAKAAREEAPSPPKAAVAEVAVQKAPEFHGIPRMELSRQRDSAGRTVAVTVRLTDYGGRPLSDADVRIRRRLGNGDVRETRLEAGVSEGSYRGPLPARVPDADGLTMRVTVGQSSHEVRLAE